MLIFSFLHSVMRHKESQNSKTGRKHHETYNSDKPVEWKRWGTPITSSHIRFSILYQ